MGTPDRWLASLPASYLCVLRGGMGRLREITSDEVRKFVGEHPGMDIGQLSMHFNCRKERMKALIHEAQISVVDSAPKPPIQAAPSVVGAPSVISTGESPEPEVWIPPAPSDLVSQEAWVALDKLFHSWSMLDPKVVHPRQVLDRVVLNFLPLISEWSRAKRRVETLESDLTRFETELRTEMQSRVAAVEAHAREVEARAIANADLAMKSERERVTKVFGPARVQLLERFQKFWDRDPQLAKEFSSFEEYAEMAVEFTAAKRKSIHEMQAKISKFERETIELRERVAGHEATEERLFRALAVLNAIGPILENHYLACHDEALGPHLNSIELALTFGADPGDHRGLMTIERFHTALFIQNLLREKRAIPASKHRSSPTWHANPHTPLQARNVVNGREQSSLEPVWPPPGSGRDRASARQPDSTSMDLP